MTTYEIKHSTELMENYVQASVMSPEKEFRAVQAPDGRALLFAIGSENGGSAFTVTAELAGERHGWETVDLGGGAGRQPCQHFAVGQHVDGAIHLAMALRTGTGAQADDTIHLSRLTVDSDGRVQQPRWTAFPYDGADTERSRVEVTGIFLSQATDGECVIVDVVRDPASPSKQVSRYVVDPAKADGRAWHLHDIPIDLTADGYASVLGRRRGDGVDGVYVGGQIDGSPQLIYTPLVNEDRPDRHPLSSYLKLTAADDHVPEAIAACANPDDSSDLYATSRGTLYRFASSNQRNGAVAEAAIAHPLFERMRDLFAFDDEDRVVVWGRNCDNVAFYTACRRDQLDDPGSWTLPLPLLAGVQHVSPFVNRGSRADTIFAHTHDNQLKVGLKSPETGAWSWIDVTLPLDDLRLPASKINSYTTRIQVFDDQKQAAAGVLVALSATNVTSVLINHLYYTVGPAPIHVPADAGGCVTVVESVPAMTGTQFTISVAQAADQPVNPMDKAFKKATDLQSVQALRSAEIVRYVDGQRQPGKKLIRPGVEPDVLERVAHLNAQCAHVYADPQAGPTATLRAAMAEAAAPFEVPDDAPLVDGGDLFQFLQASSTDARLMATLARSSTAESAEAPEDAEPAIQETVWDMLVRWFEGAWEFVVKIGEAIYRCVLRVIEDVVAAVRWVFDKVVEAVEDLIDFLRYLFEWDDFKRTKDVIKNVTKSFISHEIEQIPVVREKVDGMVDDLVKAIDAWAGLLPDVSGIGDAASNHLSRQSSTDQPDAPSSLLTHHFQGNVQSSANSGPNPVPPPTSLIDALEAALEKYRLVLGKAYDDLKALFQRAPSLTLTQILRELVGIVAGTALRSAGVIVDAVLDFLYIVAKKLVEYLDTPVHFPVISDILNAIGIPDFSMLDVMCWVAAVPVTIGYKIATALRGDPQAPFPDTPGTRFLIETHDFATLQAAFSPRKQPLATGAESVLDGGPIEMSPTEIKAVFISMHCVAGVCGGVSAFVDAFESVTPTPLVSLTLTSGTVASALLGGVARGVGNVLVPRDPIKDGYAIYYSRYFLMLFLLNKCVFGLKGALQEAPDDPRNPPADWVDYRRIGAAVDAVLVIPALGITIKHFVELAGAEDTTERTVAILDEASYLGTYIARVLYTLVVSGALDASPDAKYGVAAAMGISQIVHGGIQLVEAAVGGWDMPG